MDVPRKSQVGKITYGKIANTASRFRSCRTRNSLYSVPFAATTGTSATEPYKRTLKTGNAAQITGKSVPPARIFGSNEGFSRSSEGFCGLKVVNFDSLAVTSDPLVTTPLPATDSLRVTLFALLVIRFRLLVVPFIPSVTAREKLFHKGEKNGSL
jgi:hypothetical protein